MKRVKLYNIENTIANLRTSKRKSAWSYATDLDTVVYFQGAAKTEKHVYTLDINDNPSYAINNLSVSGISVSGTLLVPGGLISNVGSGAAGLRLEGTTTGGGPKHNFIEIGYNDDPIMYIQSGNKISISASNDLDLHTAEDGDITLWTTVAGNIILKTANTITLSGTTNIIGDLHTVAWNDYFSSSSIVGWAASPTGRIFYKRVGNLVFISFDIMGTSNTTGVQFTLPYANAVGNPDLKNMNIWLTDSGTIQATPGCLTMPENSSTVTIYKDAEFTGWTATAEKAVYGQFWYETV